MHHHFYIEKVMKPIYLITLAVCFTVTSNVYAEDVMKADANGDGKVTFEEYKAAHEAKLLERFKRKDINQDGVIDMEEKIVAKEKKKEAQEVKKQEAKEELRQQYREERKRRKRHLYKSQ